MTCIYGTLEMIALSAVLNIQNVWYTCTAANYHTTVILLNGSRANAFFLERSLNIKGRFLEFANLFSKLSESTF